LILLFEFCSFRISSPNVFASSREAFAENLLSCRSAAFRTMLTTTLLRVRRRRLDSSSIIKAMMCVNDGAPRGRLAGMRQYSATSSVNCVNGDSFVLRARSRLRRSALFVPADRLAKFLPKALASSADCKKHSWEYSWEACEKS
jgi:hypothetical protein